MGWVEMSERELRRAEVLASVLAERREIYRLRSAQIPVPVIAQRLGRHSSTIPGEISRNWMHDEELLYQGYFHGRPTGRLAPGDSA
jgi:IS30 family transposase